MSTPDFIATSREKKIPHQMPPLAPHVRVKVVDVWNDPNLIAVYEKMPRSPRHRLAILLNHPWIALSPKSLCVLAPIYRNLSREALVGPHPAFQGNGYHVDTISELSRKVQL